MGSGPLTRFRSLEQSRNGRPCTSQASLTKRPLPAADGLLDVPMSDTTVAESGIVVWQ